MSAEAEKSSNIAVPRWLTRSEKAAFRRIESIRATAGKPISEAEVDLVADYTAARSRLADLRKVYRQVARELRDNPDDPSCATAVITAARAIDTASGAARRLGRIIGLGPQS